MKNNKISIKKLFKSKEKELVDSLKASANFKHPGTKGDVTETKWKEWLSTNLPKRYRCDRAFIIDNEGSVSDQIDLVIYDSYYSPYIFEEGGSKYIPIESVYAVFEIKQSLNRSNLKYAINKIKSVKRLLVTSIGVRQINGKFIAKEPLPIIGGLLTSRSEWLKTNITKNIRKNVSFNDGINYIYSLPNYVCFISYDKKINIDVVQGKHTMISAFFNLLKMLQDMGNAPAIDFYKYEKQIK